MERRAFIEYSVRILGGSALGLQAGCVPQSPTQPKPVETKPLTTNELNKLRVIREVKELPESSIKRALQSRVVPILEGQIPQVLNINGVEILIEEFTVTQSSKIASGISLQATFTPRRAAPQNRFQAISPLELKVPLVGITRPEEIGAFSSQNVLPDGTPLIVGNLKIGDRVSNVWSPEINVQTTWDGKQGSSNQEEVFKSWGFLKEACALLLEILRMEATIAKMKEFGLFVPSDFLNQDQQKISLVPLVDVMQILQNKLGRSAAMLDLTGYVVGLRALYGGPKFEALSKISTHREFMRPLVKDLNLGEGVDIYLKSCSVVLNNPQTRKFDYVGDMNLIP